MLDVDGVVLHLGSTVFNFSLRLDTGSCSGVIGPSGAGKSTLLALIAGFATPDKGAIRVNGQDVTRWSAAQRPVTTVFQEHNLFAHLDVAANVGLGIHPGLKLGNDERQQVSSALEKVGLGRFHARLPATLSGGERQRVALARALVRRRPVLLLDEPFAALGPALRSEMLVLVNELVRSGNLTCLLVSHHPEDALMAAQRTAFVDAGRILLYEDTADLLARTDCPELSAYLRYSDE